MQELLEETLDGGWGQDVRPVKIGDTVHRQVGDNSSYVHDVLTFLEAKGFDWSPRYLGMDEQGREIIQFIEGYTPHGQEVPKETWSLQTMTEIFKKVRQFHDLTAGSKLAGDQECVCHGDLGYANTVYQDGKAAAFIDWDLAHAGQRIEDVAHAIMQYLSIGEYESEAGPSERAKLARRLSDAYGLSQEQRTTLTDTMLSLLEKIRNEQLAAVEADTPNGKRLAEAEVPGILLKRYNWLKTNRKPFDELLA